MYELFFAVAGIMLLVAIVPAAIFQWLWNSMVPEMMNGNRMHFGKAFGFVIMIWLILLPLIVAYAFISALL